MNETLKQQISAYVDGELPSNESELLVRRLSQDAELRALAAEYMAIGRAVRGERGIPGLDGLRARIAGELGEATPPEQVFEEPAAKRIIRPVAGVAIAASVALVALLGLQQVGPDESPAATTARSTDTDRSWLVGATL